MNSLLGALPLAALLVDARAATAPSPAERERTYWATVEQFSHGDRSKTLGAIAAWSGKDLEVIIDSVSGLAKAAHRCKTCEPRLRFDALPLRAAVVLHAERDLADRTIRIVGNGGEPDCTIGAHGFVSERLLKFALLQPGSKEFESGFSVALSVYYRAVSCLDQAMRWAEAGLKSDPHDAVLHLARGLAAETIGVLGYAQPVPTTRPDSKGRPRAISEARDRMLDLARGDFEKALAINPRLGEARLRLGRVQWRLGRLRDARGSLEMAVAETQGPVLSLAHLFLGQILEDTNDLEGAIREYRAVMALQPQIQIGAVALAHALTRQGNADGAREVLEGVLPYAGRRAVPDPYWNYLIGNPALAKALLEALRIESVK